ncbi:MAG: NADH dehydrogenase [Deltaproteobacteria bacterium SG8_13]|nr:MAG: NADH dehydrogenase [Deltaproteobacteria bacterium SG8_13]
MDMVLDPQEESALKQIETELADWGNERSRLIPILQMIQERMDFLPPRAIEVVAQHLGISASEVFGVATFYNQFRFTPPGKNPVKVCLGTACHVRGADIILENFERKLEIKEGETTTDREFSIDRVACVGCCALAPVALIGEIVHGKMAPSKVEGLIMRCQIEKEMAERASRKKETGE